MFKVNLEKQLLKQNKKYLTKQEENILTYVKDVLKEKEEEDIKLLHNIGFDKLLDKSNKTY